MIFIEIFLIVFSVLVGLGFLVIMHQEKHEAYLKNYLAQFKKLGIVSIPFRCPYCHHKFNAPPALDVECGNCWGLVSLKLPRKRKNGLPPTISHFPVPWKPEG